MTAFFHLGPVLVTDDVQQYWDPLKTLSQSYNLNPPDKDETVPGSAVKLPSLDVASWAWLQPFTEPAPAGGVGSGSGGEKGADPPSEDKKETKYMALGLAKVDAKPGFEKGPYTALEGYLQLKAPIIRPDAPVKPTGSGG